MGFPVFFFRCSEQNVPSTLVLCSNTRLLICDCVAFSCCFCCRFCCYFCCCRCCCFNTCPNSGSEACFGHHCPPVHDVAFAVALAGYCRHVFLCLGWLSPP